MWNTIVNESTLLIVNSLIFLHDKVTHNYGWSIILLTLIFRILILPLTFKSIKSMKAMQELQPKMKELQEKFKNDKERFAREQMALFKQHKVNPMGGCLPMLLQMPIFILLFTVLRNPERNGFILINSSFYGMDLTTAAFTRIPAHFLGGLSLAMPGMIDLSVLGIGFFQNTYLYLPTIVLAAAMAVTTIIQQRQTVMDPNQKGMMVMMNFMLIYFGLIMPSGVLLYWVLGNAFQIVQQKFTGSVIAPPAAGKSALVKAEAKGKASGKPASGNGTKPKPAPAKPAHKSGNPGGKGKKKE